MMKSVIKWIILSAILLFCIPMVSAFTVSSVSIEPSGSLIPGDSVIVSYKIQFPASGGETFPSGSELQMSTDLESAKWSWTLVLDTIDNPRPSAGGRMLSLSGFELSYPASVDQAVRVTMEGKVPSIDKTTNKTIIRIQEVDANGNVVTSSKVERSAIVINIVEVTQQIAQKKNELQTFRTHIDEKAAIGADTSVAELKYSDAKSKIDAAAALPSNQYATALAYLNTATSLITDGETALDRAWAESEVIHAQTPIANVDRVIAWFKGNSSTANNAELPPIIAKREIAVSYISAANDQIASGQFTLARSKAAEAFAKGNESYTEALALQKKVSGGFVFPKIPGIVPIIIVVILVVLVVVGVIIYRKRSQWDELG